MRRIYDGDLATRLRAVTVAGDAIVEADGDQFLVVRLPATIELTDPEDIAIALDAASHYTGPVYTAEETLEMLRHEVASEQ